MLKRWYNNLVIYFISKEKRMPILYSREQISDSIGFTRIIDSKFKTNTINYSLSTI